VTHGQEKDPPAVGMGVPLTGFVRATMGRGVGVYRYKKRVIFRVGSPRFREKIEIGFWL
jgi:hypothetical protein